jgi:putative transposase
LRQRDWDDAHLINAVLDIHAADPAFGYRFIADEHDTCRIHWSRPILQRRLWTVSEELTDITYPV